MFPFFETIKIELGKPKNLYFHQKRVDKTFAYYYKDTKVFNLEKIFSLIKIKNLSTIKCKLVYNNNNYHFNFQLYKPKKIDLFVLCEKPSLSYSYKFTDRTPLIINLPKNEEVIFSQQNSIADTSFSNLVFMKNKVWVTPKTYLLNGTQRQLLLKNNKIIEADIKKNNLTDFTHFKLINAMLNFKNSTIYPIEMITFKD